MTCAIYGTSARSSTSIFVMEGLYGNGKTKNPAVEAEFKRSKRLVDTVQTMIDRGLPNSYGEDEGILERLERSRWRGGRRSIRGR
jgi:hypothetical protein